MDAASTLPVALIPAYKPEASVVDTARALLASGRFAALVVVDDGSGPEYAALFKALETAGAVVLRHFTNLGKGMALRTGLNHAACSFAHSVGVVTLDADGQHLADDVLAVARQLALSPSSLILGRRDFDAATPLRSRFGNVVTRHVMRWLTGLSVSDTQTGLRGIPLSFIPLLLRLNTRGYDFELDMLIQAGEHHIPIVEIPIATVYLEGNKSSHFNPLLDSMKIYLVFLRFNLSSLLTTAVDYTVFSLCLLTGLTLPLAMTLGRGCSWVVNYGVNRRFVFRYPKGYARSNYLYLFFEIVMAVLSYIAIDVLSRYLSFNIYAAKILVETSLYLLTFTVQREIVFGSASERSAGQSAEMFSLHLSPLQREKDK